ncbi:MAG: HPr family phosphocarrier protein [Clostridiales bacterium]|jgi:phosphocarrier protein|nr:HPr family phosphocarrier protein [Clostridiales bacterium]
MFSREIKILNDIGIRARIATFFIQKANEFNSTICIEKNEIKINAKSLLGVLSLEVTKGDVVKISAEGTDERNAVYALIDLIDLSCENFE